MTELTIKLLQFSLLLLLWVFVLGSIGVLRRDLYGTKIVQKVASGRASSAGSAKAPAKAASAPKEPSKGSPQTLVVVEGSLVGTTIDLSQAPILIGRAPECTLVLSDDYSSGKHLRIYQEAGRWFAEDLDSTNGTFIGRDQINGIVPVHPGTQLRIGRTVLELRR